MLSLLRAASVMLLLFSLLTGLAYPALVTAAGAVSTPALQRVHSADGRVVGAELIGQPFVSGGYFWGRPSATSAAPYDAAASSGSNLGPHNPALREAVKARVAALRASDPGNTQRIPVDLVTTSGSGLDPHISPEAARWQVARVARERRRPEAEVRALVEQHVEGRVLGLIGEPRVHVLRLNLALDESAR